jgi:hypothetical protein
MWRHRCVKLGEQVRIETDAGIIDVTAMHGTAVFLVRALDPDGDLPDAGCISARCR